MSTTNPNRRSTMPKRKHTQLSQSGFPIVEEKDGPTAGQASALLAREIGILPQMMVITLHPVVEEYPHLQVAQRHVMLQLTPAQAMALRDELKAGRLAQRKLKEYDQALNIAATSRPRI